MSGQANMIDVSSINHPDTRPIEWSVVKLAGYYAVMIKASEGDGYVNPWLEVDARAANHAGLLVGYYHFARPGLGGADDQAEYALGAISGLPRDLGLALDLEVTEGRPWNDLTAWAREFHERALMVVDHAPLYTPPSFLERLENAPWGERLWLPSTARPRREVWAWQTTEPRKVPGIGGLTDVGFLRPNT